MSLFLHIIQSIPAGNGEHSLPLDQLEDPHISLSLQERIAKVDPGPLLGRVCNPYSWYGPICGSFEAQSLACSGASGVVLLGRMSSVCPCCICLVVLEIGYHWPRCSDGCQIDHLFVASFLLDYRFVGRVTARATLLGEDGSCYSLASVLGVVSGDVVVVSVGQVGVAFAELVESKPLLLGSF